MPTYAHYALVALTQLGIVDYVVSQNIDGLHRRSGLPADKLSELHGNCYIETCCCCTPPMEFLRPYGVDKKCKAPRYYVKRSTGDSLEANCPLTENEKTSGIPHITGRACPRNDGPLRDSIIHFGESLPDEALKLAKRASRKAALNLVLGCSMLVTPASNLPFMHKGPVVIVTLTCTGSDTEALRTGGALLHAPSDIVMERLMQRLTHIPFPRDVFFVERIHERVRERDHAVLCSDGIVPYAGGADGGVVVLDEASTASGDTAEAATPVKRAAPPYASAAAPSAGTDAARVRAEALKLKGNERAKENTKSAARDALECFTQGIECNCADVVLNAQLHANRAYVRTLLQQFVEAVEDCRKAIALDPGYVKAYWRAAVASLHLDLCRNAQDFCDRGLAQEPNDAALLKLRETCIVKCASKEAEAASSDTGSDPSSDGSADSSSDAGCEAAAAADPAVR
eukprot:NODE_3061_length_2099_cov_3.476166.p1 GENE.NODE_3061_length_2099_cov_3.476166~~NODE_3061_length_2099_cov_3.476166.p1  ORF type:complete len:456 (+),score=135.26 NODE_3061_length_2099_cov_3.476166:341-1708(+)